MANPFVAMIFGIVGGLIGASLYEGFKMDAIRGWDGRYVRVINSNGDFVDEYR